VVVDSPSPAAEDVRSRRKRPRTTGPIAVQRDSSSSAASASVSLSPNLAEMYHEIYTRRNRYGPSGPNNRSRNNIGLTAGFDFGSIGVPVPALRNYSNNISNNVDNDLARAINLSKAQSQSKQDAELRRKQDEEYELSMALDKSKQTHLEESRLQEEKQKKTLEEEDSAKKKALKLREERLRKSLMDEPASFKDDSVISLRLGIPGGRFSRRFPADALLDQLFIWIQLTDERCKNNKFIVCLPPLSTSSLKDRKFDSTDTKTRESVTLKDVKINRCTVRVIVME